MPTSFESLSPIGCTIHSLRSPLIVQSPWFSEFPESPSSESPLIDTSPCGIHIGKTPPEIVEPSVSPPRPIVTTDGLVQAFGTFNVDLNAPVVTVLVQVPVTFAWMRVQSLEQQMHVIVSSTQSPYTQILENQPLTFSMLATRD
jgi:hypothetical protein